MKIVTCMHTVSEHFTGQNASNYSNYLTTCLNLSELWPFLYGYCSLKRTKNRQLQYPIALLIGNNNNNIDR